MEVSLESGEGLERILAISVPAEKIDNEFESRLKGYARKAKIDGFRPGKVPVNVVRQRLGKDLRADVVADLMRETTFEAIKEKDLMLAGAPAAEEPTLNEPGKPLEFKVKFEVFPEFEVNALDGIEIEKFACEIVESDVDNTIEKMRKQHAEWKVVDRPCQSEDEVIIDYAGQIDGQPFEGGEAKGFNLILGSGSMIPGFEDGIIGATQNETRDVSVTFPKDYNAKDLAGKKAVFSITVNEINELILPEVNADFIQKFNIDIEPTLENFRAKVRSVMQSELNDRLLGNYKKKVVDKILEENPIEIPSVLVEAQVNKVRQSVIDAYGLTADKLPEDALPFDIFKEESEQRVAIGIIMSKVIEEKKLKPDSKKVRSKIEQLAENYEDSQTIIDNFYADSKRLQEIESIVLEEAVIEELSKNSIIKLVNKNYDEIVVK